MSVGLDEVVAAVEARQAALVGEMAGYLVLAVADHVVTAPRAVSLAQIRLEASGDVRFVSAPAVADDVAERGLRGLLALLLECSRSPTPGLSRAARPRATGGVAGFVRELEAALVPVNRPASRRALARLQRETARALEGGLESPDRPSLSLFAPADAGPPREAAEAPRRSPEIARAAPEDRPSLEMMEVLDSELSVELDDGDDAPTTCPPACDASPSPRPVVPESAWVARAPEGFEAPEVFELSEREEDSTRPQPFVTRRRRVEEAREATPLLGTVAAEQRDDLASARWRADEPEPPLESTEPAPPVEWDVAEEDDPLALDALDSGWSVDAPPVYVVAGSAPRPAEPLSTEPAPSRFEPRQSDVRALARVFSVGEVDDADLARGLRALAGVDAASASPPPARVGGRSG
ncbi:MAG: hypothetical protein IT376_01585 [Polyangiaceae bacterium]|nr:hypothetical protein [Polyangiaceae bacterium]